MARQNLYHITMATAYSLQHITTDVYERARQAPGSILVPIHPISFATAADPNSISRRPPHLAALDSSAPPDLVRRSPVLGHPLKRTLQHHDALGINVAALLDGNGDAVSVTRERLLIRGPEGAQAAFAFDRRG